MPELLVQEVSSSYGKIKILDQISLSLQKGEIGCLLGSSGCGKTTLLRSIAGLQAISDGKIYLKDTLLSSKIKQTATELRNIGMVFQDYALFPHLTVKQNIAFGISNLNKGEQQKRIVELLELINLPNIAKRYPHQLSGGQQQRVALARSLAPKPKLLLMDEPFSGLDIELRESLAKEIRKIIKSENITSLMVTHNQNEAYAISDTIGIMKDGKLLQWAPPFTIYHQPTHPFIASFIGQGVFINGTFTKHKQINTALGILNSNNDFKDGDEVSVLIRPDDIIHDDDSKISFKIINKDFRGSHYIFTLLLPNKEHIICLSQSHNGHDIGSQLGIKIKMDHAICFKNC
jgi:iron(III) transport system ATP-binding protein